MLTLSNEGRDVSTQLVVLIESSQDIESVGLGIGLCLLIICCHCQQLVHAISQQHL